MSGQEFIRREGRDIPGGNECTAIDFFCGFHPIRRSGASIERIPFPSPARLARERSLARCTTTTANKSSAETAAVKKFLLPRDYGAEDECRTAELEYPAREEFPILLIRYSAKRGRLGCASLSQRPEREIFKPE